MIRSSDAEVTLVGTPRESSASAGGAWKASSSTPSSPTASSRSTAGRPARRYLARYCAERGFELIRTERWLAPNEGRLLGIESVRTRFTVYINNDVVVLQGWLRPLIECAESTGLRWSVR